VTIRRAGPDDVEAILDVWLRSVRATHTFLTEADVEELLPVVRDHALPSLELWVPCAADGTILGFLGLKGRSIEALFLLPEHLRQGWGGRLLEHAQALQGGPLTVDVNEQNPDAVAFYRARGFRVVGRSPVDGGGRPFPLLHLVRESSG
jgi:putative acetyltransferase